MARMNGYDSFVIFDPAVYLFDAGTVNEDVSAGDTADGYTSCKISGRRVKIRTSVDKLID
ncbi:hypothetical protein U1Q18_051814, partial [Sarracenia purpurea var. burkii]